MSSSFQYEDAFNVSLPFEGENMKDLVAQFSIQTTMTDQTSKLSIPFLKCSKEMRKASLNFHQYNTYNLNTMIRYCFAHVNIRVFLYCYTFTNFGYLILPSIIRVT